MSAPTTGPWRIATRRSRLARAQAQQVADALTETTGRPAELVAMSTTGDDHPDRAIEAFDAKGLFVDKTRQAVLSGDCHFVVHSYKDLPTDAADGLVVAAVPRRVDPRDVLVTRDGHRLYELPRTGTTIGTSSARRRAQLMKARRDLIIQPLRGNIDTRLGRVADGDLDGVVVALAGLLRLGGTDLPLKAVALEHGECLHAPAQGALALECASGDAATRKALRTLDDPDTNTCVTAEREMLRQLQGGCTAPIGAHAELLPGPSGGTRKLELLGMYSDGSGTRFYRASHQAAATEPELLGRTLAATLLAADPKVAEAARRHGPGQHEH